MTLVEVMIVLGLLVVFGSLTVIYLPGYRIEQDLDFQVKNIVAVLRNIQQRSITQDSITAGSVEQWGAHFENPAGNSGFYQSFRGTNYPGTTTSYNVLKPGLEFETPASGNARDIFFQTISGLPTGVNRTVVVRVKNNPTNLRTITVNDNGTITY